MNINTKVLLLSVVASMLSLTLNAKDTHHAEHHNIAVADQVIAQQRATLAKSSKDMGFGPQAPRDIDVKNGVNPITFTTAPDYKQMNLCNIHFHKNAEHKGGEFTLYAGNGDGHGYQSGYKYSGELSDAESKPIDNEACPSKHGGLSVGDTIEVHYVHSSAKVKPGATLGSCLSKSINNPQLRVETQVYVLVNDADALDFKKLTKHSVVNGFHQALNIPENMGEAITYAGSTTGPGYNEKASPFQVTWNVRPKVAKVNIATVDTWCKGNAFDEDHAHGVRNLVTNPELLSKITQ